MKRYFAFALTLLLVLSLAACGQGSSAAPAAASPAASGSETAPASSAPAPVSNYPTKAITAIIPYSAGGATDLAGRLVANYWPKHLSGSTLVIENQAGGAAVPGTLAVADADPDGYTLGFNWMASWILRPQIMDTGYAVDDFTFIAGVTVQHTALFVTADSEFKTLDDLLTYAAAHPGDLTYSCGAANSFQQLIAGVLCQATGLDAVHVPYEGARQSALGMMAGDLDFAVLEVPTCAAELQAGTVRMLCTFEDTRYEANTPTIVELGHKNAVCMQRVMFVGPAGMDQAAVKVISDTIKSICADPEFVAKATELSTDIEFADSETITREIKESYTALGPVIKQYMK